MEQLVVSGFETMQFEKALEYLTKLENKFTLKSSRVLLLKGLYLESQKKWQEANTLYNSCLEQDETQMKIRKRIISILITTGKTNEAIDALVEHVDVFGQDAESWSMLSTLYYKQSLFKQAAFCCEELILMRPLIHFHHSRLASIQVRMNQLDNALKHYCRAFELCDNDKDALEGIHHVTSLLLQKDARNDTFLQLKALSVEMLAKIV
jgi:tetratricopeptide (TPR) repeat protein